VVRFDSPSQDTAGSHISMMKNAAGRFYWVLQCSHLGHFG
jgi:hypothetical protein